ncbi:MAG: hypothetical protein ACOC0C_08455 [Bacteroidota bacterium]
MMNGKVSVDELKVQHLLYTEKQEIDVIIMDDDNFYNELIKKTFLNFQELPEIQSNYKLNVTQIFEPQECVRKALSIKNDGIPKIAFIDYYLGHEVTGDQIIKILLDRHIPIEIVLISQSEEVIGNRMMKIDSPHQNKIYKHGHTPVLCCMMLNRFIKTLENVER